MNTWWRTVNTFSVITKSIHKKVFTKKGAGRLIKNIVAILI
jgi:hypothetical protein